MKLCCDYSNSFSNVKVGNEIGAEDRRSRPSSYTILFVTYILDAAKFCHLAAHILKLKILTVHLLGPRHTVICNDPIASEQEKYICSLASSPGP